MVPTGGLFPPGDSPISRSFVDLAIWAMRDFASIRYLPQIMSDKRYRKVTFYDAQRRAETGIGTYTKSWTVSKYGEGELDRIIEEYRAAQKAKNVAYNKASREARDRQQTSVEGIRLPVEEVPGATVKRSLRLKLDEGTGNSTVLLGSSKAGKSTTMMYLYRRHYGGKDFISILFASNPQIALYRPTDAPARRLVTVSGYDPRLIRLARAINRGAGNKYKFCFLLDDIIDQRQDQTLAELILTLRNSNISSMVCLQYGNLLAKMSRSNVNNVLLFRFNNDEAIEVVIGQYLKSHFRKLGIPPDNMVAFYKTMTADHGFIYLHPSTDTISFHRLPAGAI